MNEEERNKYKDKRLGEQPMGKSRMRERFNFTQRLSVGVPSKNSYEQYAVIIKKTKQNEEKKQ